MWGLLQAVVKKTEKDFVLLVGKGYGYLPKLQSYAKHGYVDMLEYWLFKRTDLARTSGDYEKKRWR